LKERRHGGEEEEEILSLKLLVASLRPGRVVKGRGSFVCMHIVSTIV
jgi:hypothetical protein